MKDNWHIIALGSLIAMITLETGKLIFILLYLLWLSLLYFKKRLLLTTYLIAIIALLFFNLYLPSTDSLSDQVSDPSVFPTQLSGKIISSVSQTDERLEFTFLNNHSHEKILIAYFFPSDLIDHTKVNSLKHGAFCTLSGETTLPTEPSNPYQFDYRAYLLKKDIAYQLVLEDLALISCQGHSFLQYIYELNSYIKEKATEKLSAESNAWLHALVLGDDRLLDADTIEVFRRWGISHLLAISGLHIGIVVGIVYFLLIRLGVMTKEKAQWTIIVFLPIYAVLAGGQPSVWRASLMVLLVIIINKLQLKYNYTDILSIVFIALLIFNKYIYFHVGFQLSFAVTFGLILSQKWMMQAQTNVERVLQISFVSQMMIVPLQLSYFGTFQALSILLNIVVVPIFSLVIIPLMFVFLLLLPIPTSMLLPLEVIFMLIQDAFLFVLYTLDKNVDSAFYIAKFPLGFAVIYYVIFVFFMIYLEKGQLKRAFQYGVLLVSFLCILALRPYLSPVGMVTMLDIGQGDAIVVELPYRKGVFFIDIGTPLRFPAMTTDDRVYKQVIKPYLIGRGIKQIDAVFISHEHVDHYGSLEYLVKDFQVGEIVISDLYEMEIEEVKKWTEHGSVLRETTLGETIEIGKQRFYVVAPSMNHKDANENSLVLYTELGGLNWLFTGDAGKLAERELIHLYDQLRVDVLKVGHHGSDTSTGAALLQMIQPDYALIPVGRNNIYGHPNAAVLDRLAEEGVKVYQTDEQGAIQYIFSQHERGSFLPFINKKEE